jgi:HK97 family phage prohead protease
MATMIKRRWKLMNNREYRIFNNFEVRVKEEEGVEEKWVEGYAARYDSPTVIWEYDGVEYKEQIVTGAFDGCDMSDVIFQYNHEGRVMARTRNKTLELKIDTNGLFIRARLDGTEEGRKMYEEINNGYIDKMSFGFTVKEDSYDNDEHMRNIRKVKKLYDVSAVSLPAYDSTSISARSYFETQKEEIKRQETEKRRKKLSLLSQL